MQKLFYIIILAGFFCHAHAVANTTRIFKKQFVSADPGSVASGQKTDSVFAAPVDLPTIVDNNDNDEQDAKSAPLAGAGLFHVQYKPFVQPGDKYPSPTCCYHKACRLSVLYSVFRL